MHLLSSVLGPDMGPRAWFEDNALMASMRPFSVVANLRHASELVDPASAATGSLSVLRK